jgi:hypothetical protein
MRSAAPRHLPVRPPGLADQALSNGLGGVALVFGVAALGPRRAVRAEAIQEHCMTLEDLCIAVMRPGHALVRPVGPQLWSGATAM